MIQTIAVTNKWQLQIPKKIREKVGMNEPGQVQIQVEDNKIIITPSKSRILSLAGKYHKYSQNKAANIDNIRDQIDYSDL